MTTTITPSQLLQTQPGVDTKTSVKGKIMTPEVAPLQAGRQDEDRSSLSLKLAQAGGASTGPVFDRTRVDALRVQIGSGQYHANASAIASALLAQSSELHGLG